MEEILLVQNCKNAMFKFFITANIKVRAIRRYKRV